ncbi:AAA family ATPase [Mucilaginibacter sp. BJC16-A38]|uniref:ATP-dependent nuclease n=1 Tax=Mucilaginibacter phenanthrenivorans TaxID=1234842 RepID=UPI002157DDEF|nr:AAA family ATPase [Mucilaginibacter phenanthrenivorans]MCR8557010.1 AAA family ATPase [Mucilaginibacter phenanthrenivorans]
MHLSNLKLWNFRKFGSTGELDLNDPDLNLPFNPQLNLLIGENDSGKSSIIDAIKLVLKTHSNDWIKIELEDFYLDSNRFRIECTFIKLSDSEAKNFIEWLGWTGDGKKAEPYLRVILDVSRKDEYILPSDIRAGVDPEGHQISAEAREYLKVTYLKPLRDAKTELIPKRNSRLSQILSGHHAFKGQEKTHRFVSLIKELNDQIEGYFKGLDKEGQALTGVDKRGEEVKTIIDKYLGLFSNRLSRFEMSGGNLKSILEGLSLLFLDELNLGLGSHNLLFIASELLHLQRTNWDGLKLGLVEEIEAHLHPQIQLQVMETLQKEAENIQLIFTTHSPNIGSKIRLENLIICQGGKAFPMGNLHTKLDQPDYKFLERFLDVTKANLFFSRGLILVEGWAEELFLPALAKNISINLTKSGISVINIANTAFLRYAKIFQRNGKDRMDVPVAVITDVDVKPLEAGEKKEITNEQGETEEVAFTEGEIAEKIKDQQTVKAAKYDGQVVKTFVSPFWTLEYCLASSEKLRKLFYKSVLEALLEQKNDGGVQKLDAYRSAIANVELHFNNWSESREQIAYKIYDQILTGKNELGLAQDKISKSIVAQRFADNLETTSVDGLRDDESIKYLIAAIDYASGN